MKKTTFTDFMSEVEAEARAEGPAAVEELETFRDYFRLATEMIEARKAKRWSQQMLAAKAGLHQSEISDIERGCANPTFQTLQKVARSLDGRIGFLSTNGATSSAKSARQGAHASARKQHRASDRRAAHHR